MRRKVLVTGASGFLGTRVVTSLLQEDSVEVYAGFNTSPLNDEIPKFCHVCCNNLSKPEEIKKTLKGLQPDVIIHLGAISSPGRCEADPGLAFATNDAGALVDSILEVAPDTVVVFASSDLVYDGGTSSEGGRAYHPANDESLVQPLNIYAKTKAAGEENIKRLKNGVILRLSNMIGEKSIMLVARRVYRDWSWPRPLQR
jgi:dTDP-4-dehydrorhamnose reductase